MPCCGALGLAACSPALDWRQTAPPVPGLHSLLPCRAERAERTLTVAGAPLRLEMAGCEAGGALWAIASAEVPQPARQAAVRQALDDTLLQALGRPAVQHRAWALPGSSLPSIRLDAEGRRADGRPVHLSLMSFAQGSRVYRACVLFPTDAGSPAPAGDALDTFAEGLRLQAR